jgi:hypothetical protein
LFNHSALPVNTAEGVMHGLPSLTDMSVDDLLDLKAKAKIVRAFLRQDANDGGKAAALWPGMIQEAYPQVQDLRDHGDLCGTILHLVMLCWHVRMIKRVPLHDFVEGFAGKAMVTLHMIKRGFNGQRLDASYHETHNIITHFGSWLHAWMCSRTGALHWTAPLCSSFVIMCRGPSGRRPDNHWWGNDAKEWVELGNQIMVRTALLVLLSHLLDCKFVIEQPMNSVMFKTPPLSTVLAITQASRTTTWHNAFGASSPKPFTLMSSIPLDLMTASLKRKRSSVVGIKLVNQKGRKFSGNSNLKQSQAYTAAFGRAVSDMWATFVASHSQAVQGNRCAQPGHARDITQIFVTLAGATVAIDTSASTNIGWLLDKLKMKNKASSCVEFKLWFEGVQLQPERDLADYAIQHASTLMLTISTGAVVS